jgi:hypothetical protein
VPAGEQGSVDVLESGTGPTRWERLSRRGRLLAAAAAVLVLAGLAVVPVRGWLADREQRRQVRLETALTVSTSSTSPPGGEVLWSVSVHNAGPRPVTVTALDAATDLLTLRMLGGELRVAPGRDASVPLSVLLTCRPGADPHAPLVSAVRVRRADGDTVLRRTPLTATSPLEDVTATVCGVRPDTRGRELSGPLVRD